MKKFNVEVSENASVAEIASKIAKSLIKHKQLSYRNKQNLKLIGNRQEVEVIENEIQINVTRKLGKHDEIRKCGICGTEYMQSAGFGYKTNYGGSVRSQTTCSEKCFDEIKKVCGDRVAKTGKKLIPIVKPPDFIGTTPVSIAINHAKSIKVINTNGKVSFTKGDTEYEPTFEELKAIYFIFKILGA